MTEEDRKNIRSVIANSEENYDKNILYIAAGTLVISITFLEKIVKIETAGNLFLIIISWIFLALCIIMNLLSHQVSGYYAFKIEEVYDLSGDDENQKLRTTKKHDQYNLRIRWINWLTSIALGLGISFLVTFCSLNINNMKQTQKINLDGTKGATIPKPTQTSNGGQTTTGNQGGKK
jgi:hypothetical protein